jgi:hypothetical protein
MLFINRLLVVGLLSVGIAAATTAQAESQLFEASWTVKAFGNECDGKGNPPHCTVTTGDYAIYSNWAIPGGWLCNPGNPRCPFSSTPVDATPNASPMFDPLGGSFYAALHCTPYAVFTSGYKGGASGRPAKGGTVFSPPPKDHRGIPPLYRNTFFFTTGGQPKATSCTGTSTGYTTQNRTRFGKNKGYVQAGVPAAGSWYASVGSGSVPGFSFSAAPATTSPSAPTGIRASGITAEFTNIYPYIYSYTYANLRNDAGIFGKGSGPGSFNILYKQGAAKVASINVTAGKNKFGGVMRMLGSHTNKACYYRNGGCSLGQNNWRYEAIGASGAATSMGVVTKGYIASATAYYYQTAGAQTSTVLVSGARFPWTTGSVTVTAVGRGPHKTVHYMRGYDNRTTVSGKGTIQLVTPVLTRWLQPALKLETAGIGILRIKFIPEPQTWAMLVAGASLLCVGARMRRR